MTYAQRLKELRIERDLTQEDVAKLLQTTQQYYGKYENAVRPLPISHLVTLCKYYGVTSDWVLGLSEKRK